MTSASRVLAAALLPVLISLSAAAASIDNLSTDRDEDRYAVSLHAYLDVPVADAYAVFADVNNWKHVSPNLRQLEVLDEHRDGVVDLRIAYQACVLWYCRLMFAVPDVFAVPGADGGDIYMTLRANTGDFRSGHAHWRFRKSPSGTELEFSAEVEPAFSVPPIIGPWLMARWLRAEAVKTSSNIEALASARAEPGR